MKKLTLIFAVFLFSSAVVFSQNRAKKKSDDFIPGDKIIFLDSLKGEQLGEFPSKWDLKSGTVEVMEMNGQNVIGIVKSQSGVMPLMKTKAYLPNIFTLEFDVYFHNKGNEAYTVEFDNRQMDFSVRSSGISHGGYLIRSEQLTPKEGWLHLAMSFNQRALKVYLNGERLVNVPNVETPPTKFSISALSHNARNGKYAMIANVRLAEGGVPLYDRLLNDGRFVTNDIHFEYGQATLKSESMNIIQQVAEMLKEHPEVALKIEGHTDSDGSDSYNLELSQKRAQAVKEALIKQGVDGQKLTAEGFGESKPVSTNDTDEGRASNRRVEFVLVK
jgi:outer membrane protein OmpA-like peptidoglycan-associated protein